MVDGRCAFFEEFSCWSNGLFYLPESRATIESESIQSPDFS
jgi:hypothetical protein